MLTLLGCCLAPLPSGLQINQPIHPCPRQLSALLWRRSPLADSPRLLRNISQFQPWNGRVQASKVARPTVAVVAQHGGSSEPGLEDLGPGAEGERIEGRAKDVGSELGERFEAGSAGEEGAHDGSHGLRCDCCEGMRWGDKLSKPRTSRAAEVFLCERLSAPHTSSVGVHLTRLLSRRSLHHTTPPAHRHNV